MNKTIRVSIATLAFLLITHQANAMVAIWGIGEKIYQVCDLPNEAQISLTQNGLALGSSVGYKMNTFQIFWMPVFQWDGEYVFFKGDNYCGLRSGTTIQKAASDIGISPGQIKKPILAYFPWGWLVIGPVLVFWIMNKLGKQKSQDVARAVQGDVRYIRALEILAENPTESGKQEAIAYLCEQGIPEDKAEVTLANAISQLTKQ